MLPRVSSRQHLRWILRSFEIGGAALGLALLILSESPAAVLALLGVGLVVLGGVAWARVHGPLPVRLLLPAGVVILARVAAGTSAAALTALLMALGAVLRVRAADGIVGMAIFGAAVAILGGASLRVVLAFWFTGLAIIALRAGVRRAALRRGFSGMRSNGPPFPS